MSAVAYAWTPLTKLTLVTSIVLLTASLSLNVTLLDRRTPRPRPTKAIAGDRLPPMTGISLDGATKDLVFTAPTLVYVFSATCDWCRRDYQNLVALHREVGRRFEFVGLAISNTRGQLEQYLKLHPFPGDVLALDLRQLDQDWTERLGSTPQMLVVEGGYVERAWLGALFGARQADVERFFGVSLPGASTAAEPTGLKQAQQ